MKFNLACKQLRMECVYFILRFPDHRKDQIKLWSVGENRLWCISVLLIKLKWFSEVHQIMFSVKYWRKSIYHSFTALHERIWLDNCDNCLNRKLFAGFKYCYIITNIMKCIHVVDVNYKILTEEYDGHNSHDSCSRAPKIFYIQ